MTSLSRTMTSLYDVTHDDIPLIAVQHVRHSESDQHDDDDDDDDSGDSSSDFLLRPHQLRYSPPSRLYSISFTSFYVLPCLAHATVACIVYRARQ